MTYDTAHYTIEFTENHTAASYQSAVQDAETEHVTVSETRVTDAGELVVTVSGSAYVLPMFESELRAGLPDNVMLTCEVEVGSDTTCKE